MITWKLWSALHTPPASHPIFLHVTAMRAAVGRWRWLLAAILGLIFIYSCYQLSFLQPPVRLILLSLTLQDVVAIFVGFNLVYGCVLAVAVSQTLARARLAGMYDMLCLTPMGQAGVAWLICAGAVYRGQSFGWFRLTLLLLTLIPVFALTIHLVIPLVLWGGSVLNGSADPVLTNAYYHMLRDLVYALALIAAFYTACVQSVILALLIGMISPAVQPAGASLSAVGFFLLLQLASLLLAFLFSLFLLPAIFQLFGLVGEWAEFSIPLWRFGFFFSLREGINLMLWRLLTRQMGDITFTMARLTSP